MPLTAEAVQELREHLFTGLAGDGAVAAAGAEPSRGPALSAKLSDLQLMHFLLAACGCKLEEGERGALCWGQDREEDAPLLAHGIWRALQRGAALGGPILADWLHCMLSSCRSAEWPCPWEIMLSERGWEVRRLHQVCGAPAMGEGESGEEEGHSEEDSESDDREESEEEEDSTEEENFTEED